jgi:sugar phosphate isomerase/epimerase
MNQRPSEPLPLRNFALRNFALHTITTKPWSIETAIDNYARAGFGGISIWRDAMEGRNPTVIRRQLADAGLVGISLVRGGFIAHREQAAQAKALDDNRRCIAEAADLGLPLIVMVCGADPSWSLPQSRTRITEALIELAPEAAAAGIRFGIEALHPMYADSRSAINTLAQANAMARTVNSTLSAGPPGRNPGAPTVCSVVDIYHLWWDPCLEADIDAAGRDGLLAAFHVCDWRVPTEHMLLDRGLMGEGCIDIPLIRSWVEKAGFTGTGKFTEVEIFSERYWKMDQTEWLARIAEACHTAV